MGMRRIKWYGGVLAALVAITSVTVVATRDGRHARSAIPRVTLKAALANFGRATDYYLKLGAIKGDVIVRGHEDEIDVQTIDWSVSNLTDPPTRAAFSDVTFTKFADPSSPELMLNVARATHIGTATFTAEAGGSTPFAYAQLVLSDVRVTSFKQSAQRSAGISESVTLRASQRVLLKYVQQNGDGSRTNIIGCWDLTTNARC